MSEPLPIPTGHPDYEILPEKGGYAVVHKTGEHGGMGAVRFAATDKEALEQLESMKKANGDA